MSDQSIPHLHQVAQDAHAYTERVRRSGVLDTLEAASAQYAQHMQALGSSGILDAMETCQPVLTQVQGMVNTAPFREVLQHVDAAPPVVPVPPGLTEACQGLQSMLASQMASSASSVRDAMGASLKSLNWVPVICERLTLPQEPLPIVPIGVPCAWVKWWSEAPRTAIQSSRDHCQNAASRRCISRYSMRRRFQKCELGCLIRGWSRRWTSCSGCASRVRVRRAASRSRVRATSLPRIM